MQFLCVKKWCSANVFSDTKQNHVCWKMFNVRKVFEVRKMSDVFRAKLYCKMSDLFPLYFQINNSKEYYIF